MFPCVDTKLDPEAVHVDHRHEVEHPAPVQRPPLAGHAGDEPQLDLVCDRGLGEEVIHSAIVEMMRRGWLTAFFPRPTEWDRRMVFVPQQNDFAAIIRYVDQRSVGIVPRGLIESRTNAPVEHIATGMFLSHIGIGITAIDGNNVFIRGTNPGLALMMFHVRAHPLEHMRMESLVKMITGKHIPRRLWNDDLRLRVALAFDEFNCDVPGVLDDDIESDVQSRWSFPPPPPPPAPPARPRIPTEPPFPAAPEPTDFDPGIPPF